MRTIKIQFLFFIIIIVLCTCKSYKYPSNEIHKISFNQSESTLDCNLIFPNPTSDVDLIQLKEKYNLDSLTKGSKSDLDKALTLMNWTHNRWEHNGSNIPQKSNPLYILEKAEKGERYRCVEYGIVLSAVLNSTGLPTRTLGLKTKDIEITKYGAGHVVSETYIPSLKKWVFLDAQINYIPFLDGVPLNAVEYQKAIINDKQAIELRNKNGIIKKEKALKRINWVGKYLYYFDISFNSTKNATNCQNKSKLMLVPLNAIAPTVFQINSKMTNYLYTNNVKDFYKNPKIQ